MRSDYDIAIGEWDIPMEPRGRPCPLYEHLTDRCSLLDRRLSRWKRRERAAPELAHCPLETLKFGLGEIRTFCSGPVSSEGHC